MTGPSGRLQGVLDGYASFLREKELDLASATQCDTGTNGGNQTLIEAIAKARGVAEAKR